jgi:hypothetical protein
MNRERFSIKYWWNGRTARVKIMVTNDKGYNSAQIPLVSLLIMLQSNGTYFMIM